MTQLEELSNLSKIQKCLIIELKVLTFYDLNYSLNYIFKFFLKHQQVVSRT